MTIFGPSSDGNTLEAFGARIPSTVLIRVEGDNVGRLDICFTTGTETDCIVGSPHTAIRSFSNRRTILNQADVVIFIDLIDSRRVGVGRGDTGSKHLRSWRRLDLSLGKLFRSQFSSLGLKLGTKVSRVSAGVSMVMSVTAESSCSAASESHSSETEGSNTHKKEVDIVKV